MKKINLFKQMDEKEMFLHWFICRKKGEIRNGNNWGDLETRIQITYVPFNHTLQKRYIKAYTICNEKGIHTYTVETEWTNIDGGVKYLNSIINAYRFGSGYKIDFYM